MAGAWLRSRVVEGNGMLVCSQFVPSQVGAPVAGHIKPHPAGCSKSV